MKSDDPTISFRAVTADDLPLLRRWMEEPHWKEWWGDLETEIGYITDMVEGRDTTRPFIFDVDGQDTGYIQYWIVGDQLHEPWLTEAPWMKAVHRDSIGVDLSIGDSEHLSKGIGTAVLKAFVTRLRNDGFTEIIIDPDPANKRAVRAYEKAGFVAIPDLLGKTGDTLIMRHEESDADT